jgi:SAM-dependent methyltransferase
MLLMVTVHHIAAHGFAAAAETYERGRPGYPPQAIELLVDTLRIERGATVLDLGAGTGKLTRALAPTGARLLALEPVEEMRRKLAQVVPSVTIVDGVAEAIPLPDGSVDAAVAGQSFHWFHGDLALPEIHRVLRPGGRLGLLWNARDLRVDWVARISAILDGHGREAPHYLTGAWRHAFEETSLFSPIEERELEHRQELDMNGLLERAGSISYIAALPREARYAVLNEVRDVVRSHPALAGRRVFTFPYRTLVATFERR